MDHASDDKKRYRWRPESIPIIANFGANPCRDSVRFGETQQSALSAYRCSSGRGQASRQTCSLPRRTRTDSVRWLSIQESLEGLFVLAWLANGMGEMMAEVVIERLDTLE